MSNNILSKKNVSVRYILLLFALIVLCWLFPYTGDDWAWGSSLGMDRLNSWFYNYNGRYLSNLLVMVMTRSRILRALIMAITFTGIVWYIEKFTGKKAFIITAVLFTMIPRTVMRQAIVWTSGFGNYSFSMLFTLMVIDHVRDCFLEERKPPRGSGILLLILGLVNTLIIENLTLYHLFLSFCLVALCLVKRKDLIPVWICYLVGTLSGTVIMFSNTAYRTIMSNEDDYRTMGNGDLMSRCYTNYFDVIFKDAIFNNIVLNILLALALTLMLVKFHSKIKKIPAYGCVAFIWFFVCYSFITCVRKGYQNGENELINGALTALFVLSVLLMLFLAPLENEKKYPLLFSGLSALIMVAPLFVVTPIGPRCFFCSYVMLSLLVCQIFELVSGSMKKTDQLISIALILLLAIGTVKVFYIYGKIFIADNNRTRAVMEQYENGSREIPFPELPYNKYLWKSSPDRDNDIWEERYKLFHNISQDVDLITEDV